MQNITKFLDYLAASSEKLIDSLSLNPQALQIAIIATIAGAVFLGAILVINFFRGMSSPVRRRFYAVAGDRGTGPGGQRMNQVLEQVAPVVIPSNDWERTKTQAALVHAGFRKPDTLTKYYVIKVVMGFGLPILAYLSLPIIDDFHRPDKAMGLYAIGMILLTASVVGMLLPNFILSRLVNQRKDSIRKGFPDALDLLVVAIEAGLGLTAAIDRVGRELRVSHPDLSDELQIVSGEILGGMDRSVALRNLAVRTGVDDVQVFTGLISQTLKFGTGVAVTLRVFAEEFRDKRMQRAEEQAAKIGLKLIFPLILCLLPAVFVVLVGPATVMLGEAFRKMGASG